MLLSFMHEKYGGKRAFLFYMWGRFACLFGGGRKYKSIDFSRVDRIIFVCIGNVCRSPFAEHVLLSDTTLSGIEVLSCGVRTSGGTKANPQGLETAKTFGIDLTGHASIPFSSIDLNERDLLVGMEPEHIKGLPEGRVSCGAQLTLLGVWGPRACLYIQDPYGRSDKYFHNCYCFIQEAVKGLSNGIKNPGCSASRSQ